MPWACTHYGVGRGYADRVIKRAKQHGPLTEGAFYLLRPRRSPRFLLLAWLEEYPHIWHEATELLRPSPAALDCIMGMDILDRGDVIPLAHDQVLGLLEDGAVSSPGTAGTSPTGLVCRSTASCVVSWRRARSQERQPRDAAWGGEGAGPWALEVAVDRWARDAQLVRHLLPCVPPLAICARVVVQLLCAMGAWRGVSWALRPPVRARARAAPSPSRDGLVHGRGASSAVTPTARCEPAAPRRRSPSGLGPVGTAEAAPST